jgi:type I restriction enzyme, S subunit
MRRVLLKDICRITIGKTPNRNNPDYWGEGAPWLSISDMTGKYVRETKEFITEKAIKECGCKLIPQGTLLLSFKLSIGKLSFTEIPMYTNEAIAALEVIDDTIIDKHYLYYALQTVDLLSKGDKAVKGLTLNKEKLGDIEIPLLPINQQKHIVAVLDEAHELINLQQENIVKLDELLKAIFLEMFGDPVTNPKGIPTIKIKEMGKVVTGNTPSKKVPQYYGNYIEWIKSDNINTPYHFLTQAEEYLSEEGAKKGRVVPANSILVTCIAGSKDCIGNAALSDRPVAFNQQINAIVPNKNVDPYFLYTQILLGKKLIQNASTNGMKGIVSKSKFEEISLMNPKYDMQKRFGSIFIEIELQKRAMLKSLQKLKENFQSLLIKAFNGELKIKDEVVK